MARRNDGTFTVGGDERRLPSLTAAVSLAQTFANQATEPRQWGVFDNGTKLYRVERHDDRSITTTEVRA